MPNPTTNFSVVEYSVKQVGRMPWLLVSAQGRIVATEQGYNVAGRQSIRLDLRRLPPGAYIFNAVVSEGRITQ